MSNNPPAGSQTVDRALQLLECFTEERPEISLTDFSKLTGFTMPTTHRLLKALQAREYIAYDGNTRLYSLGPGSMRLASLIIHRDDINEVVLPWLDRLRRLTGETVAMHWLVDRYRVCTLELESRHLIKMASGVGRRYPLYAGAAGRVILSLLPDDEIDEILKLAAENGLGPVVDGSLDEFMSQIQAVREKRVAQSNSEVVDGASAVAVAILNASNRPIGALNITGPASRFDSAHQTEAVDLALEAVADIETRLGYRSS